MKNKKLNAKVWLALTGVATAVVTAFIPDMNDEVQALIVAVGGLLAAVGIFDDESKDEVK
ncbi:hypothetical protein EG878_14595 [Enterococcus faecalis]|nr:hypothetical protein EG878_14595 [Enterococcus faecalis]